MTKQYLITVGVFGFVIIFFGTFISHLLTGKLTLEHLNQYNTGLQFMMFHTVALLGFAFAHKTVSKAYLNVIYIFFVLGMLFYSFGMMIEATSEWTDLSLGFLSFIIPLGGMSFMAGWLYIAWMGLTGKYKRSSSSRRHRSSSHGSRSRSSSADFDEEDF